jgi:hypothetical protein
MADNEKLSDEVLRKQYAYAGKPKQWQEGFDALLKHLPDYVNQNEGTTDGQLEPSVMDKKDLGKHIGQLLAQCSKETGYSSLTFYSEDFGHSYTRFFVSWLVEQLEKKQIQSGG